jgi:hypothetical protein
MEHSLNGRGAFAERSGEVEHLTNYLISSSPWKKAGLQMAWVWQCKARPFGMSAALETDGLPEQQVVRI